MNYLNQLLNSKSYGAKTFTLLGESITFREEQTKYINLKMAFNNVIKRCQKEFEEKDRKLPYVNNQYKSFINMFEVYEEVINGAQDDIVELWDLSGIGKRFKANDNPIKHYTPLRGFLGWKLNRTTYGKMLELTMELEKAKEEVAEKAESRSHIQNGPRHRWVGGGFGISGAIKGAVAAGLLNMAADATAKVGQGISNYSAKSKDMEAVYSVSREINALAKETNYSKLFLEIQTIIDLYFDTTMNEIFEYTYTDNKIFSYRRMENALSEMFKKDYNSKKESIITAIISYPFSEAPYEYIKQYFPQESQSNDILATFSPVNYVTRADLEWKHKIGDYIMRAHVYREGNDISSAINELMQAHKLDPQNQEVIDTLKDMGVYVGENISTTNNSTEKAATINQEKNTINNNSLSMPIEDIFPIAGRGTVVTGTIKVGNLKVHDKVIINGKQVEVLAIESYRRLVDYADMNTGGIGVLVSLDSSEVKPGDVLSKPTVNRNDPYNIFYRDYNLCDEAFKQEGFRNAEIINTTLKNTGLALLDGIWAEALSNFLSEDVAKRISHETYIRHSNEKNEDTTFSGRVEKLVFINGKTAVYQRFSCRVRIGADGFRMPDGESFYDEVYVETSVVIKNNIEEIANKIRARYANVKPIKSVGGGCYVATAIYGTYDCPQVWTLRRYRDNTLAQTWYGRMFIRVYYAISPTIVKLFGQTEWFNKMWRGRLDRMVANLQANGIEDTPYTDRTWR